MQNENYQYLKNKLYISSNDMEELISKRLKTYRFARSNLLWVNFEKNIFKSYEVC